jgi:hypothetical protein
LPFAFIDQLGWHFDLKPANLVRPRARSIGNVYFENENPIFKC